MFDFLMMFVIQRMTLFRFTLFLLLIFQSFELFFSFSLSLEGFFQHPKAVVHLWAWAGVIPPLLDATDGTAKP
jgi:hypothetical protein